LLVDYYVSHGSEGWLGGFEYGRAESQAQFDFLRDVGVALLQQRTLSSDNKRKYHQIETGLPRSYYHDVATETQPSSEEEQVTIAKRERTSNVTY
jgi:hypothetical protein